MKRWGMRSATFLLTCAVLASPCVAQTGGNESNSITIGDISKVDLKAKSITIKNAVSYDIAPAVGRGGGRGGSGRGAEGRGGRRGGEGGGGSSPRGGSGGFTPQTPRSFKVALAKALLKQDDHAIGIGDLKIGDHVQVLGQTKGSKVEASEVVRMPKNNPVP